MHFLRFRIQTLMIAVAVAAVVSWAFAQTRFAALLLGPTGGVLVAAGLPRYRRDTFDRPVGVFCGALAGSAVQAMVLWVPLAFHPGSVVATGWPWLTLLVALLLANAIIGVLVGLVVAVLDISWSTVGARRGKDPAARPLAVGPLLDDFLRESGSD